MQDNSQQCNFEKSTAESNRNINTEIRYIEPLA